MKMAATPYTFHSYSTILKQVPIYNTKRRKTKIKLNKNEYILV